MHWVSLRSRVTGTTPDEAVAVNRLRRLEDGPLVEQRIEIVQLLGRRAIVRDRVNRQVLREIGLHHGYPHFQEPLVLRLEPRNGFGVGEVDGRARLGKTVHQGRDSRLGLHQEAAALAFGAHLGIERDVGAFPQGHLEAQRSELLDHALRTGKRRLVPFEVPVVAFVVAHPVRIDVDHVAGNLFFAHPAGHSHHFVPVSIAPPTDPEAERPVRRDRGPAGQLVIATNQAGDSVAGDQVDAEVIGSSRRLPGRH